MQSGCKALRKDGLPCGGWASSEGDFCFAHDPAKAKERAAARRLGGQRRRRGSDPSFGEAMQARQFRDLDDMEALLESMIKQSLKLDNSVSRNRAVGYLVGQWCAIREVGELEARLVVLEQKILEV